MKNLNSKIRSQKLDNKVDLTAMTSISFLLLIFFMVTIEIGKPRMIAYESGSDWTCGNFGCYNPDQGRIITLLIGENNSVTSYQGLIQSPIINPKKFNIQENGIVNDIENKNKSILKYSAAIGKPSKGATIIIKPSAKSEYGNLITILNILATNHIEAYTIVNDYTPEEKALLSTKI